MGKRGMLLFIVCGLALAACGGKGKTEEADSLAGPPDVAETATADGRPGEGDAAENDPCMPRCDDGTAWTECGQDDGCGGMCP